MKNKKTVLWIALLVMAIIPVYAQQYNAENEFEVQREGNGITITSYNGSKTVVNVPPRIQNLPVTSLGDWVFSNKITSVTIPNSVTSIPWTAFQYSYSLTAINVDAANAAYSSENGILYDKAKTSIILVPVKWSGTVTIPASVTDIGGEAFHGRKNITAINVVANNTVFTSENGILYNKAKTTLIRFPAGKNDASFIIPNSVKTIGNYAFSWCESLARITIPNNVTSIGSNAFGGCTGLTSIAIPNSVTSIKSYAFAGCTSLTSIAIPNSVKSIEYATFFACTNLTSVTIPDSVTSIEAGVFSECTSLRSITIPNSVKSIGEGAFEECPLSPAIRREIEGRFGKEVFYFETVGPGYNG